MEADRLETEVKAAGPTPEGGTLASRKGSVASNTQKDGMRESKERLEVKPCPQKHVHCFLHVVKFPGLSCFFRVVHGSGQASRVKSGPGGSGLVG